MSITASIKRLDDLSASDTEALDELKTAVYPPEETQTWEGASREWTRPRWGVFVVDNTSNLASWTGVVRRKGAVDGRPVSIGGLGGIVTHPDHRGKGYAPIGMGRALDFLIGENTDFAVLVCRDDLVGYYSGLGWRRFEGDLLITQFGEPEKFAFNNVMVGSLIKPAPTSGIIDLKGPPW